LLEALSPKADKEGGEADGHLSVDEVVKYVRDEYPARAKKLANADQRPLLASRGLHFSIAPNLAVLNEVRERLKKFEAVVAKANLPEPVAKEGRDYLARMPRLKSQQEMRKHYQALAEGTLTVEAFNAEFQKYVDARKLTQKEAEEFATKILEVANKAKMGYVKPIKVSDLVAAAIKGLYKAIGEDKNIPKNILAELDRVKDKDERALKQLLVDVRSDIGRRDDLKDQKGTFAALESMLHSLDNYSTYIDPETLERWKMINTQVFIGVGIQIQRDVARDMVRVSTPLRNSPAYKEGIKAGDLITKVTNFVDKTGAKLPTPVEKETKGLSIDEVVKTILGPERTQVKLTVERDGKDKPTTHEFTITRGRVEVETVFGVRRLDDDTWDFYLDRENKIGYVRLNQFALMSERDLKRAVESLSKTGLNGLILDLRFNPGGYLESAVKISDLFIDDGLIVTVRPREGRVQEFRGYHEGSLLGFPLVVLVNGQSASASEIVSACIQDHSRGIVMGERSFGKGSVQNIINLPWGDAPSQMKLTTASFWRPNNKNLNRFPNLTEKDDWGVQPHPEYTLKLPPLERGELFEHLRKQEIIPRRDAPKKEDSTFVDKQLNMALDYLKRATTQIGNRKAG
jgi:C-terminal peptidase prc